MCRYSSNSKGELARYRLAGIFYGLIAVLLLGAFGSVLAEVNVSISRGLTISDNDSVDTGDAGYDTTPDVVGVSSPSLTSEGQSAELGYRFSGSNSGRGVWNLNQQVRSITQSVDVYVEWTITATEGEIYSFSLDPELHGYLNILDDNNSEADDIAEISNFNATLTQNGSNIINDQLGLTGGSRDTVGSSNIDDAASRSFGGLKGINTFRLQYTGSMLAAWKIAGVQDNRTANALLWGQNGTMDGDSFADTFDNYATTAARDADGLFVKGTVAVTSVPDAGQSVISVTSPHIADGNDTALVTVQVKDASGNNLAAGGATVVVSGDGSALVSGVTDNDDGTYTATVTNAVAETVTISATLSGASITSGDPTIEFQPPLTTQIDLSPVFNADIVRGQDDAGSFDPCCAFVSSSIASANGSPAEDGLPDDGVFTAAAEYPRVELAAFNEPGDNAWKVTGTPAFTASVTPGNYNELHVFASAGDAGVGKFATFRLTVTYADGSRKSGEFEVADWFDDNAIVTDTRYYLINGMDRWNGSSYDNANNPAVFGFRLPLESNRVSQAFTIDLLTNTVGTVAVLGAVATTDSTTDTTFYWIDTTVAPNGGGEISCTNNPVASGGSSTCAAIPSPGFTFDGWSGACSGAGDCSLSNVTSAAAVTATFTPTSGSVVVSTDASTGGSLDPVGRSVLSGSTAMFNVEPDLGYQIDAVSGCGGSLNTSVSPNTYTTGAVTADCTVTASFSNEFTLTFDSNGGSVVSPITQVVGNTVTAPAAPTRSGYAFAGWSPAVPATMPAENLSLTAQWTANSYTLNFDAQGGSVSPSSKGVTYDQPIGTLPVPTRTGYTFSGWDTAADGSGATWTAATVYTTVGNSALHAQWTPNVYTLTFDAQGGSVTPSSKAVTFDAAIGSLPSPTRTGYTFAGWNTEANGSGATWTAATIYTTVGNSALHAQWTLGQYMITFDSNGGTAVTSITQDFGTAITAPADPSREGYTFNGWNPTVPATMPAENLSLTAQWTIDQHTITFDSAGGTAVAPITQDFGTTITAPSGPTREGYTFRGWNPAVPATMPAENRTLTAQWTVEQYTITFDSNGGTAVAPITQDFGTAITAPADPTREGYTFNGWSPSVPATMPAENLSLTAQWNVDQYTITFDSAGGTAVASITQAFGTAVTAPAAPTRSGYAFAGWNPAVPATMPAENRTLTAQWTIDQHTITFDSAGGTAVASITQDFGTTITAPSGPTREGYTFRGWNPAVPATMPAENRTLTAQWTVEQYTITFDSNGGTAVAPITQDFGTAITAPADPTREGYTFNGWSPSVPATMPAENLSLTAQWNVDQYTITFDSAGGTAVASITQAFGTAVTAPAAPTRSGYAFAGWNPAVPATMPAENRTLTAQWTIDQHTITFDSAGGTAVASITQNFGTAITAPADPTRDGYTFAGWSPVVPATMPAGNRTLMAQWSIEQYNVTVSVNPPAGGSVNGAGSYDFGSPVSVQATAASGYEFVSWTEVGDPVSALTSYTFAMPAVDRDLTADFSLISYSLAVINGTGDGDYVPGTEVGIAATAPPEGQVFDAWTGDIEFLVDPTVPNTAVTMPEQAITLTATYKAAAPETFALNVVNGSGGGEYMAGSQVTITASPATDGQVFDRWIGDVGFVTNANLPTTDVIMPEAEVAVEATYKAAPPETFALIVNAGTGSGEYEAGRVVSIAADPPPEGQIFDRWSGDIAYLDSALNPNTTVVMPGQTITLTAIYKNRPAESFELTVRSGSGGGEYPAGQTVTVAANSAPEGQVFDRWRGDTAFLVSVNVPNTQVVMPAEAVVIEAAYKVSPPKTFVLSVNSGTGSGNYEAGEVITVAAEPAAEGEVFARWSGQTAQVTNVNLPNTTLTMPAADVSITADYESEPVDPQPNVLTVVDGTGDGEYEAGRVILIAADVREGEIFDRWIGQTATVTNVNIPNTMLVMPNGDATVTATFKSDPEQQFQLRVRQRLPESVAPASRASHDKSTEQTIIEERTVPAGLLLRLVAPAPPGGLIFDKWIGQTTHVDNIHKTDTFLYMPSNDVDVTATYREPVSPQTLVVESGSGDGNYLEGAAVTITANAAPAGFVFERWEGQTAQVANVNRPETTLEMPPTDVRVRAVYRERPEEAFELTVLGGSGDGSYAAGSVIQIVSQAPPADQVFARWAGQVGTVADLFSDRTTVYMPATEVTVVAQFANVYQVTAVSSGPGGTLSPTRQDVVEGERAVIELNPNPGWIIGSVTGCGDGNLSGTTWTTGQIEADCELQVQFELDSADQVFAVPVNNPWLMLLLVVLTLGLANVYLRLTPSRVAF